MDGTEGTQKRNVRPKQLYILEFCPNFPSTSTLTERSGCIYFCLLKGNCHEQFNLKKTAWTFQVWFKAASMQDKTARTWRVFGGERDHYRQKSRFRERKVARKPGMLPQTNLLKCMRSSWQFPFKLFLWLKFRFKIRVLGLTGTTRFFRLRFVTTNSYTSFGSTVVLEMCCAKERTTTSL